MKNPLNEYFNRVVVLGSKEHRPDRHALIAEELGRYNIEYDWFDAHWKPDGSANWGCSASHRSVLGAICLHGWARTLIIEDDWTFISPDWVEMFSEMSGEVPVDWKWLFLGASYAEDPKRRVSGSVIESNGLHTTSCYGIKLGVAQRIAPFVGGNVGIDASYVGFQREGGCFVFDPRLGYQRKGVSDIQNGLVTDGSQSMLDNAHVDRLDKAEFAIKRDTAADDCI